MTRFPAALLLGMLLAATPVSASGGVPADLEDLYEAARHQVLGITFTVKPMESEPGVEGPKAEGVMCGVAVDDAGTVLVPGDVFPETGGDPRSTLAPTEFEIHLDDGRTVPAEAAGLDRNLNVGVLKFDPEAMPGVRPVRFRERPELKVGDEVIIVGLLGRKYGFAPALYRATISAAVREPVRLYAVDAIIQDLAVGGLVLRQDGSAAGVIANDTLSDDLDQARAPGNFLSLVASNMGQPQARRPGYAMVLPYPAFAETIASPPPLDLTLDRKRAWIGIVMQALREDLRDYWELPVPGGIIIGSVVGSSPAEAAGLQAGDVIVSLDGDPLRISQNSQLPDFRRRVERMEAGKAVELEIYRGGTSRRVEVFLGDAPKTASLAEDYEDEDFGLTVREITIDVQQALNLDPTFQGVVVESTENSGWADVSGLAPQDLILALSGTQVGSVQKFRDALSEIKERRESEAIFFVMRPPDTLFVRVRTDFDSVPSRATPAED
jgi:S1-C subfamily serine protease